MAGRRLILLTIIVHYLLFTGCNFLRSQVEFYVNGYNSIIEDRVVYVHADNGDDNNPGTSDYPKKTIQCAVDLVKELVETGTVRIAEGTYTVTDSLIVRAGVSIYGGYSNADWSDRSIDMYITLIKADGIEEVLIVAENADETTTIEGFTIQAAWEYSVTAVYCENCSPTIRYNNIDAGRGITNSIGIFNISSSPIIIANTINAGHGDECAWGIANEDSSPKIRNNVIYGSGGAYKGILNSNSPDVLIQNNTICAGTSAADMAIYNSSSRCVIENNIIFSSVPDTGCGIYENNAASMPVKVNNNDFYSLYTVYRKYDGTPLDKDGMEVYLSSFASANMTDDPDFVEQAAHDYHLKTSSPIKESGKDLSDFFTIDRDGNTRTPDWSIGAFEQDF